MEANFYSQKDGRGGGLVLCAECGGGLGSMKPDREIPAPVVCSSCQSAKNDPGIPQGYVRVAPTKPAKPGDLYFGVGGLGASAMQGWREVEPEYVGRVAADFNILIRKNLEGLLVISGGQTGADIGALVAARRLGIRTGGFAPRDFLTERGPQPVLAEYGLVETQSEGYSERTYLNVLDGDLTLVLSANERSTGTVKTIRLAQQSRRPVYLINPWSEKACEYIRECIAQHNPGTINFAGNRESRSPGISRQVAAVLNHVLTKEQLSQ